MRIGMFLDMYKPHLSGVTTYVNLYKRELEALGHEVYVFTYGNRDYIDDESHVYRSAGLAFGSTGWQIPLMLSGEARRLLPTLDVAHAHHPFTSTRVALRCHPKAPVVFTSHTRYDLYGEIYMGWAPKMLRERGTKRALNRVCHKVDAVLAPSPEIARWLRSYADFGDAIVFRNVIDVEQFASPSAPRSRAELGFEATDIIVMYLGRIAEEKNVMLLVDAFVAASAREPRLAMMFVGDGPSRGKVEARLRNAGLADRARFIGSVPHDECPDYLATADLFATASVSEAYPLVVMEAAAAGLPAIGIKGPGVGEVILDGQTGLLTDNDTSAFTDALALLASDARLREEMSANARSSAKERHDVRPAARELEKLYAKLLAERRERA